MTDDFCGKIALDAGADPLRAAESAVRDGASMVACTPNDVGALWAWLENAPVKIIARFDYTGDMAKLSEQINTAFKNGASGASIMVPAPDIAAFATDMATVRDDLFFNRDMIIKIDAARIAPTELDDMFSHVMKLRPAALECMHTVLNKKYDDFVGRIYGLLNAWPDGADFDLYFDAGADFARAEQVLRLAGNIRPGLNAGLRFFIDA